MPAPKGHMPYPGCETGGRPLEYTQEFLENEAEAFLEWMNRPGSIYFKRFAIERGYSPTRLHEFAQMNKKFSRVYEYSKHWQEMRLAEGGLTSEFNSGFCKFVMGNVCNWVERHETKVSGDQANPLAFVITNVDGKSKDIVSD